MNTKKIRFIDLFSGIGGFRYAIENTSKSKDASCVFSSEINRHASEIYYRNFNDRPFGDITKIKSSQIPSHDLICAGFPCQSFSISGKKLGLDDARGTLFYEIIRIASYHTPRALILENVKNLYSHSNGQTLAHMKKLLENIGYSVFYKVLRSSDFGIPQARERIYIVALYKFKGQFIFPKPLSKVQTLKDILIDLKDKDFKKLQIKRDDIKILKKECKIKDLRKPYRIGIINKGCQGERIYSINASSITLSAFGGGVAAKTGAYKIGPRIRKLHPIECLRLQGLPDSFIMPDSSNLSYQLLGNSVTTTVISEIYKEVKKVILQDSSTYQKLAA